MRYPVGDPLREAGKPHTSVDAGYNPVPMARERHGLMRRCIMGTGIATALFVASATSVAAAAGRHAPSAAASSLSSKTTLREPVPAPGTYLVVVSVRARTDPAMATLYMTGEAPRHAVRATRSGTRLSWQMFLKTKKIAVLAVSTKPVRLTMTLSPRPTPHARKKTKATVPPVAAPAPVAPAPTPAPTPVPTPAPAPTVSTTPTSPPATIGGSYANLLWSSTFNGAKGTPPPAAWTADAGSGCGAGTLSTTTSPANISNAQLDGNGNLAITAQQTGPNSYTSAELSTIGSFSFMYGTVEARIWLPAGQGLCSAFWMVGNGPTQGQPCGPTCGELDVIEAPAFGALPTTAVFTAPRTDPGQHANAAVRDRQHCPWQSRRRISHLRSDLDANLDHVEHRRRQLCHRDAEHTRRRVAVGRDLQRRPLPHHHRPGGRRLALCELLHAAVDGDNARQLGGGVPVSSRIRSDQPRPALR